MPSAEAAIATERPSRYLEQLCKHAAAMGSGHGERTHLGHMLERRKVQVRAEWTKTRGLLTFTPWGQCALTANAATLHLRVDAGDEDGLHKIQDVLTRDLERIGRRDGLTVRWSTSQARSSDT